MNNNNKNNKNNKNSNSKYNYSRAKQFHKDTRASYIRKVIRDNVKDLFKKTVIYSETELKGIIENLEPSIKEKVELHNSKILREYTGDDFIEKPVALCTSFVRSGINFNNTEPVDLYITIDERTTADDIIQFVGRFRKSKSITVTLLNFEGYHIDKSKENLQNKCVMGDETTTEESTEDYKLEQELYEAYLQKHRGWENVLKELPSNFCIVR